MIDFLFKTHINGIPLIGIIVVVGFIIIFVGGAFIVSLFSKPRDDGWDNEELFDLRREQNRRDPNNPS